MSHQSCARFCTNLRLNLTRGAMWSQKISLKKGNLPYWPAASSNWPIGMRFLFRLPLAQSERTTGFFLCLAWPLKSKDHSWETRERHAPFKDQHHTLLCDMSPTKVSIQTSRTTASTSWLRTVCFFVSYEWNLHYRMLFRLHSQRTEEAQTALTKHLQRCTYIKYGTLLECFIKSIYIFISLYIYIYNWHT